MFDVLEKTFLILTGAFFAPLISAVALWWTRRRLPDSRTTESRAFLFYSMLNGILLGQYVCHTAIVADGFEARLMNLCALAGFVFIYWLECEARMWGDFENYVQPLDTDLPEVNPDSGLRRDTMELEEIVSVSAVNTTNMSWVLFAGLDLSRDRGKRYAMLLLLYVILAAVLFVDGMLLIYRAPTSNHAAVVACFVINGISLSVAVIGGMVHAHRQLIEDFPKYGIWSWVAMTLVWSVLLVGSALPAVLDVSRDAAASILEHYATLCCYGFASGCVLKLCVYYFQRSGERSNRRIIRLGVLVLAFAAAQSAVTGLWLW